MSEVLVVESRDTDCLRLTLNRPAVHNALNAELIEALSECVHRASEDETLRSVVIDGAGKSFCAGADLNWLKAQADASAEEHKSDAARLFDLLRALVACPKPVIAQVHGAALGGGTGLVAACDLVAATPDARFGLTEVRLGIAPAMIFPFLMRKVQRQHLLAAALLGRRFVAAEARELGVVNEVSETPRTVVEDWLAELRLAGPVAIAAVKRLFSDLSALDWAQARQYTTGLIARLRAGAEGQEGMQAFLQRRPPNWVKASEG